MSKLRYKEGGVWKSIAPSQKEFDDNKAETAALLADNAGVDKDMIMRASIYNHAHLKNWRVKRGKMLFENVKMNVALWSDSIGEGFYAENPLTRTAQKEKSYAGLLQNHFKTTIGDVGVGWLPSYPSNVALREWTQSGTWVNTTQGISKSSMRSTSIGAYTELVFDGTGIEIAFSKDPFGATCDIYIDGVFNQSYDTDVLSAAPAEVGKVAIVGLTAGTHTLKIVQTKDTQNLNILGAVPTKGLKGINLFNYSFSGDSTTRLSGTADYTTKTIGMFPFDLVIIGYLTNDVGKNIVIDDYKARLSTFVDTALAQGSEVILLAQGAKSDMSTVTKNVAYRDIMKGVADEKGVCMVDWIARWRMGNELPKLASQLYDLDHPNEQGHIDLFQTILHALEWQ